MVVINLQTKDCKSYVNYTKPSKIVLDDVNKNDKLVFQLLNPMEEVKHENLNRQDTKKLNKWIKSLTLSASSFLVAIPVSAQEVMVKTNTLADLPSPEKLIEFGQWAQVYATGIVVIGGIIWVVATRVLQFPAIKKYKDMALEIATNTVKGITEALMIPILIGIIVSLSLLLFGGINVFNLPL